MATNTEPHVNTLLAGCLHRKHPFWKTHAEQRQVFERGRLQPDIVISHSAGLTIVVETSFSGDDAEKDAKNRIGERLEDTGEMIEQAVATGAVADARS